MLAASLNGHFNDFWFRFENFHDIDSIFNRLSIDCKNRIAWLQSGNFRRSTAFYLFNTRVNPGIDANEPLTAVLVQHGSYGRGYLPAIAKDFDIHRFPRIESDKLLNIRVVSDSLAIQSKNDVAALQSRPVSRILSSLRFRSLLNSEARTILFGAVVTVMPTSQTNENMTIANRTFMKGPEKRMIIRFHGEAP